MVALFSFSYSAIFIVTSKECWNTTTWWKKKRLLLRVFVLSSWTWQLSTKSSRLTRLGAVTFRYHQFSPKSSPPFLSCNYPWNHLYYNNFNGNSETHSVWYCKLYIIIIIFRFIYVSILIACIKSTIKITFLQNELNYLVVK